MSSSKTEMIHAAASRLLDYCDRTLGAQDDTSIGIADSNTAKGESQDDLPLSRDDLVKAYEDSSLSKDILDTVTEFHPLYHISLGQRGG